MDKNHISQTYHEGHRSLDLVNQGGYVNGYGTPLCAMENMRIERIVGDSYTSDHEGNLERGYGVWATGLETGLVYLYWHTQPILPINGGDVIKRGGIIAWMGNAGKVFTGGVYVPLEQRTTAPFPGTHLHLTIYPQGQKIGTHDASAVNPLLYLNWDWEPQYSIFELLSAVSVTLKKLVKIINYS